MNRLGPMQHLVAYSVYGVCSVYIALHNAVDIGRACPFRTMMHNRLDPADIAPEALGALSDMLAQPGHVALVDDEGRRAELPSALFQHLVRIVQLMADRRTVVLIPEDETFTTQAAANYLGVSRQHLVGLLEAGTIPFHKVGSHRRVTFRDLVRFEKLRDTARRNALRRLGDAVDEAGLYDASYTGDDAG